MPHWAYFYWQMQRAWAKGRLCWQSGVSLCCTASSLHLHAQHNLFKVSHQIDIPTVEPESYLYLCRRSKFFTWASAAAQLIWTWQSPHSTSLSFVPSSEVTFSLIIPPPNFALYRIQQKISWHNLVLQNSVLLINVAGFILVLLCCQVVVVFFTFHFIFEVSLIKIACDFPSKTKC